MLALTQVSFQDLLDGSVVLSAQTVTIVLCDDVAQVEALYSAQLVDAQIVPPGGSEDSASAGKVCVREHPSMHGAYKKSKHCYTLLCTDYHGICEAVRPKLWTRFLTFTRDVDHLSMA